MKITRTAEMCLIIVAVAIAVAVLLLVNKPVATDTLCTSTGGTVVPASCCASVSDFPNTCLIGACGCAPENSHSVDICDCGADMCWDDEKGCTTR